MPPSDDAMALELRLMRPEIPPDFAAKLDRRAAEGFPRRSRTPSWTSSRQRLVPVLGAASLLVVVAGIAVGQSGLLNGNRDGNVVGPTAVETSQDTHSLQPSLAPAPPGHAGSGGAVAPAGEAQRSLPGA